MIIVLFWCALLGTVGASGVAIFIGGNSERLGGILLIGTMIGEMLIDVICRVAGIHIGTAFINLFLSLLCAIGFLIIAVRTSSIWLAGAMIVQAVELFVSASSLGLDSTHGHSHAAFIDSCTIAVAVELLVAALLSTRKTQAPPRPAFTRLPTEAARPGHV